MEIKEAKHKMEFMRDAYQKLIDEKVSEGTFVGTDIKGTWESSAPLFDAYREHVEACNVAIAALEKLEQESDKSCDTCKYKSFTLLQLPCRNCFRSTSLLEDYYEPYTAEGKRE